MAPERQNEIWVILPHWFRKYLRDEYDKAKDALALDPNNPRIQSHISFLECYFGKHNLTTQADEKLHDDAFEAYKEYLTKQFPCTELKTIDGNGQNSLNVAESVETSTKEDAYFAYRLDLAKEIAVAMISPYRDEYTISEMGERAVEVANEIVKRLKETEE